MGDCAHAERRSAGGITVTVCEDMEVMLKLEYCPDCYANIATPVVVIDGMDNSPRVEYQLGQPHVSEGVRRAKLAANHVEMLINDALHGGNEE